MLDNNIHCFWHQKDDFTITSQGFIWTYPGKPVCKNSIFLEIANHFDLQKKNNLFIDHKKRLDPRMRETNTRFVEPSSTRVSEFESAYFRDHLDMKVMNELNYEIQE
jgi:hypothetical protein